MSFYQSDVRMEPATWAGNYVATRTLCFDT